ncbi:MAG: hypothetical protein GY811_25965 [Myxococcales bacterium]|nr:hypothetical protein [Myxococcales bacterium]
MRLSTLRMRWDAHDVHSALLAVAWGELHTGASNPCFVALRPPWRRGYRSSGGCWIHRISGFENYAVGTGCTDDDECTAETDNCIDTAGGVCTNTDGGLACSCDVGYVGDGVVGGTECIAEQCSLGTGDCVAADLGGICTTVAESYTCSCEAGFEGDGTMSGSGCTEVDECTAMTLECNANTTCDDQYCGAVCLCDERFEDQTAALSCSVDIVLLVGGSSHGGNVRGYWFVALIGMRITAPRLYGLT